MTPPKVTPLKLETYLAVIKNSVGTRMFRTYYALVDGKRKDIMRQGELSCAFFVSFILSGFSLIEGMHGTVEGTVKDLKASGWRHTKTIRIGCVIVWEPIKGDRGEVHRHIGFYVGNGKAISNDYKKGMPRLHPYKTRKITGLYWNSKLNSSA